MILQAAAGQQQPHWQVSFELISPVTSLSAIFLNAVAESTETVVIPRKKTWYVFISPVTRTVTPYFSKTPPLISCLSLELDLTGVFCLHFVLTRSKEAVLEALASTVSRVTTLFTSCLRDGITQIFQSDC